MTTTPPVLHPILITQGEEENIEDVTLSPSVAVKSKSSDTSQHLRQTQAENDLIDSYMSDDLETLR